MELTFEYLPLLQDLIPQILEKDFHKIHGGGWDLLELEEHDWSHFLKIIEEKTLALNTFFSFYTDILPNTRNLFENPNNPKLDEVFKAQENLLLISIVFRETRQEFEKSKNLEAKFFDDKIWKEIAQTTKQKVWHSLS